MNNTLRWTLFSFAVLVLLTMQWFVGPSWLIPFNEKQAFQNHSCERWSHYSVDALVYRSQWNSIYTTKIYLTQENINFGWNDHWTLFKVTEEVYDLQKVGALVIGSREYSDNLRAKCEEIVKSN